MMANSDYSGYDFDAWDQESDERNDTASRFAEAASDYEVMLQESLFGMGF